MIMRMDTMTMKTMTKPKILVIDIAWAAGFIDGEGHIKFQWKKTNSKLGGNGRLAFDVAQVDIRPLEKLKSIFGGKIYGPYKYGTNKQYYYKWYLGGQSAKKALSSLMPYFLVKKEQSEKALVAFEEYDAIPDDKKGAKLGQKFNIKKTQCPYCGLIGASGRMTRYHFDNCKQKLV